MYPSGGGSGYYVLSIQRPSQQPESRSIDRQVVTIGRSAGDISLGDPLSSGRHAEIYFQNGQVYVRDVGSTNGTYYNGMRMPEFALQPGQSFQCGQTILTLMGIFGGAPQPPQYGGANPALAATVAAASPYGGQAAAPQPAQPAYAQMQPGYTPSPQYAPAQGGYPQQQVYGGPQGYPPPPQGYGGGMQPAYGGGYGQPPAPPPQMPPPGGGYGGAMVPVGSTSPVPPGPPPGQPQQMMPQQPMVGGVRVNAAITGGDLFGKMFVGFLLCMITFGIYLPWFVVGMTRYLYSKSTIGPTARGNVRLSFQGTGGQLFVLFLIHGFLTAITFGLYRAWFMCKQIAFFADNTHGQLDDGTQVQLRFEGKGSEFFLPVFLGTILTMITLGIYFPWFLCNMQRLVYSRLKIVENGQQVGAFEFTGQGGKLLGTYIVGFLLTMITFQIYGAWFKCKLYKFRATNTRVDYHGHRWVGDFTGNGLDLFLINLVGMLLLPITLGIYMFWFLAKQLRFQFNNLVFHQMS